MLKEKNIPSVSPAELQCLPSPAFIIDEQLLTANLKKLHLVKEKTGCKILLAQKAFATFSTYPLIGQYLDGTTASGLYEARLGHEEMPGREIHCFSPGFTKYEIGQLLDFTDHIVFNSFSQWLTFRDQIKFATHPVSCGLRINPEYSEVATALYDPCSSSSRLGIRLNDFLDGAAKGLLEGIEGLHFHCLCEQGSDALLHTWEVVKRNFGSFLPKMKWINMGGGHHITKDDYDLDTLCSVIKDAQNSFGLTVYLEPGEAVALNAGFLKATVLDVVPSGDMPCAILDTSAACHMPDVLEMPYQPRVFPLYSSVMPSAASLLPCTDNPREMSEKRLAAAKLPLGTLASPFGNEVENANAGSTADSAAGSTAGSTAGSAAGFAAGSTADSASLYPYRLAGPTCLAGDVIGSYNFPAPLFPGDQVFFCDMAIYSMVKTNTFNGMPLPAIVLLQPDGKVTILRRFSYADFRNRL